MADDDGRRRADELTRLVVSDAAHELRTPLTAIRLHSEVVLDLVECEPGTPPDRFLRIMAAEADRMAELLDDLRESAWSETADPVIHRSGGAG